MRSFTLLLLAFILLNTRTFHLNTPTVCYHEQISYNETASPKPFLEDVNNTCTLNSCYIDKTVRKNDYSTEVRINRGCKWDVSNFTDAVCTTKSDTTSTTYTCQCWTEKCNEWWLLLLDKRSNKNAISMIIFMTVCVRLAW
ncbi:hypothetical protein L596_013388 [Steinernema carpocapsae]|uniref:Uncharacterized protein n=1 Tax=Steinernema carpocapsae TaxID=34508 RepID=A0A4U5P0V2_STECR|nr:hypothetical protein L596_013388 [Steinernema carpocapsae]